jgi:hypothetical protein
VREKPERLKIVVAYFVLNSDKNVQESALGGLDNEVAPLVVPKEGKTLKQ